MKTGGFSLIEVLLTVVILALIVSFSMPAVRSFWVRNDLDISVTTIAQTLRRASVLAEASDGDSNWGVDVRAGKITLYKGASFASRDQNFDESSSLSASIVPDGESDVSFVKFTGLPQAPATIVLTSTTNETRTITVNSKGTVTF
jgi:prepilin-type N-terminal cleavage/methylation domain-containing protein